MALIYNGTTIPQFTGFLKYNNTTLYKVVYNGTTVWDAKLAVPKSELGNYWPNWVHGQRQVLSGNVVCTEAVTLYWSFYSNIGSYYPQDGNIGMTLNIFHPDGTMTQDGANHPNNDREGPGSGQTVIPAYCTWSFNPFGPIYVVGDISWIP